MAVTYSENGVIVRGGQVVKPGTYYFFDLNNLVTSGTATKENYDFTGWTMTKVKNATDYKVYLFGTEFKFNKITLTFYRTIFTSGNYQEVKLFGKDESILLTKVTSSIPMYENELIQIPANTEYSLTSEATKQSHDGIDFICDNDTAKNNATPFKYEITNDRITVYHQKSGVMLKMGSIEKGMSTFGGFYFNNNNQNTNITGVGHIIITVE